MARFLHNPILHQPQNKPYAIRNLSMSSATNYHYVIIEGDQTALRVLQRQVAKLPRLQSIGAFTNLSAAVPLLESQPVDLLLMDITPPAIKDLDVWETIANPPQTIVFSNTEMSAVRCYELGITDYLLKPFGTARLEKAVQRALDRLNVVTTPAQTKYVVLKSGWEAVRIPIESINYVEAFGAFCKVHTTTGVTVVSDFLSTVYAKLPPHLFLRIHKSFVVASWKVNHMASRHVLVGQAQVPVGASYRQTVEQALMAQ